MTFLEKRKYPRIDVDYVTVEVYRSSIPTAGPDLSDICSVVNLSENGMRFHSNEEYSTGQVLRLTFVLPDSAVIIRTNALVVHAAKVKVHFETGVQFKNLGITEQKLIKHFVDKNLAE